MEKVIDDLVLVATSLYLAQLNPGKLQEQEVTLVKTAKESIEVAIRNLKQIVSNGKEVK